MRHADPAFPVDLPNKPFRIDALPVNLPLSVATRDVIHKFYQNQEQINDVEVDGGDGCVAPTTETVQDGSYTPLSRPLFIYVKNESLQKPEVKTFVQYLLDNEQTIAENALFVPLTDEQLQESQSTFEAAAS